MGEYIRAALAGIQLVRKQEIHILITTSSIYRENYEHFISSNKLNFGNQLSSMTGQAHSQSPKSFTDALPEIYTHCTMLLVRHL
jgi:hypothetical protein